MLLHIDRWSHAPQHAVAKELLCTWALGGIHLEKLGQKSYGILSTVACLQPTAI